MSRLDFEIIDEAKDFFEDLAEGIFKGYRKKPRTAEELVLRTQNAYQFTERVDSLMKIVFGLSVLTSALIAAVWGFAGLGDVVKNLVTSSLGRIILGLIGINYMLNGWWRYSHSFVAKKPTARPRS